MQGQRILLHFGAVDYKAWVWINGTLVGSHTGGSTPFAFEITPFLRAGKNELVVRVFDDTRSGLQARRQAGHAVSEGCVYTRTTGIWQPVWLEAVGQSYIESLTVTPDPDHSRARSNWRSRTPRRGCRSRPRLSPTASRSAPNPPQPWGARPRSSQAKPKTPLGARQSIPLRSQAHPQPRGSSDRHGPELLRPAHGRDSRPLDPD